MCNDILGSDGISYGAFYTQISTALSFTVNASLIPVDICYQMVSKYQTCGIPIPMFQKISCDTGASILTDYAVERCTLQLSSCDFSPCSVEHMMLLSLNIKGNASHPLNGTFWPLNGTIFI